MNIKSFLQKRKYELLLVALIQHLYIGIVVSDMPFYVEILWPINMVILGLASVGVFIEKGKLKNYIKNILTIIVIAFPILLPFFKGVPEFMILLNVSYVIFYSFIFLEVFNQTQLHQYRHYFSSSLRAISIDRNFCFSFANLGLHRPKFI